MKVKMSNTNFVNAENCFNLKSLELHVTMTSYFSEVDSQTVTNYNKVLTNIKVAINYFSLGIIPAPNS